MHVSEVVHRVPQGGMQQKKGIIRSFNDDALPNVYPNDAHKNQLLRGIRKMAAGGVEQSTYLTGKNSIN